MRKIPWLWLGLIFCFFAVSPQARAACGTLTAGMTENQVSTALSTCVSGNTLAFPAGSYGPWTTTMLIPCGVSLIGPTVGYSQTPNQTATINGSTGFNGWGFQTTSNCGNPGQTIQYLEWNGQQPTATCASTGSPTSCGGGGFLLINAGTTGLTVTNDWLHGVNGPNVDGCATGYSGPLHCVGNNEQEDLIFFTGGPSGAVTSNVVITKNIFGSTSLSDCGGSASYGAMAGQQSETNAGFCDAVAIAANVVNVSVDHNIIHWLEEGTKDIENQGECNPLTISYNDYSHIQRIPHESQCNNVTPNGGPLAMLMNLQYNSFHDRGSTQPAQQNYDISAANGCTNPTGNNPTNCITHMDYNVDVQAATGQADVGEEIWGGAGTTGSYNYLQGYLYNGISWSASGQFVFNYNNFNLVPNGPDNTDCTLTGNGGYWNRENNGQTAVPSCTGNTFATAATPTGTTPSAIPTLSPAAGTYTSSQTVTITNSGTNRDTNTTDWCTTDGSNPVPGGAAAVSGNTAQPYYNGGTIAISATTTVKCVGMWGALNQPYSYASGWGYVPSSISSATYTISAGPCGSNNTILITTYGGAVGNGSTDNTTAINNTFSYAKTNGCQVEIPAGTFNYSNLLVANGITVFGLGSGSILQATNTNAEALEMEGSSPAVSNLVLLGTGSSRLTAPQQSMIWVNAATNYTINNVLINGGSNTGIWDEGGTTGTETNNTVENTLADSMTNTNGASGITEQNNLIIHSGDDGMSNNSYTTDGNTVNHVTINQNTVLRNAGARGLEVSGGNTITFSNNYVDVETNDADMYITSETSSYQTQASTNITVTGNTFVHGGPNQGAVLLWAESASNTVSNVTLNNNQFWNTITFTAVQTAGAGALTNDLIENSNAYINPVAFYSSSATGGGNSITQTNNQTFATTAYPGAIAPPTAGTVPVFSLPAGAYALPFSLSLNEPTSGDAISYCLVATGTCSPTTAYSAAITISTPEVVCALGTNNSSVIAVPSATVCAAYSSNTTLTAATPVFSPTSQAFAAGTSLTVTVTDSTPSSSIFCTTNGTTPTPSSPLYTAPFTVSTTTTIQCVATAPGYLTSAVGTGNYTQGAAPTITSQGYQGNTGGINTLAVGATAIQQSAYAIYSDGQTRTLPDTYGNTAVWSSSNPSVLQVTSTGLISCLAVGTANSQVTISPTPASGVGINPWGWTCTTPVQTGVTLACAGGATTVSAGSSLACTATCQYQGGSSANCNSSATFASSNTAAATVNTSGVVTGVAVGSTNLTATAGGFTSAPPLAITVTNPLPTLTGVTLSMGGTSAIQIGQQIQATATCNYSGGVNYTCSPGPDPNGTSATGWASSAPAATISSTGLVTGVSAGITNLTVQAGTFTSPPIALTVNSTPPPAILTGVTITGSNTVVAGQQLTLGAQCSYSDGSTTNCQTTDSHGNVASGWASSITTRATVSTAGVVTGVAAGPTAITVQAGSFTSPGFTVTVTAAPTTSICGVNQENLTGSGHANFVTNTYCVTGTNAAGYNAYTGSFFLPSGAQTAGAQWDLLVTPAPSGTTQAAAPVCVGTYTTTGTSSPNAWVTVNLFATGSQSACHLTPSTAYWIGAVTNSSVGTVIEGFYNCGGGSGCVGAVPTAGQNAGTYPYYYASQVYGTYSGNGTALTQSAAGAQGGFAGQVQKSQYITLTSPPPTLTGGYEQATPPGTNTIPVGGTIALAVVCTYSDGSANPCFPTPDVYGNTVTSCAPVNPAVVSVIPATSASNPCLITGISGGSSLVNYTLTGGVASNGYFITSQSFDTQPIPGAPARIFRR